jgi:macrolide transport system ATP-binding/permease protein
MDHLRRNLGFALRQLRRNPGYTATVILTLALSIGANTAIFSIVNALLLRNLPYAHPERMGTIFTRVQGGEAYNDRHWIDGTQWEMLRDSVPSLISAVSSGMASGVNLTADRAVQYVHAGRVSQRYFDVLGIRPSIGRNFSQVEDNPHGPKVAILSNGLWRTTFNGDPTLIGRAIQLKGEPYTIIGVLPQDATTPLNADLYTPLQPSRLGEGGGSNFEVITRLRDGATWQQADAEINHAWAYRLQQFAKQDRSGRRIDFYSVPLQQGQATEVSPKAWSLMMAAGFILLIACANLAGLTLVRLARRTPEITTRLALGASRSQIQIQLWIENLLLAIIGGAVGIGVGFAALRGLLALLPENYLPVAGVSLDGRVLAFTLLISVLTSVLFGMLPALVVRKIDLRSSMANRSVAGGDRLALRQMLIAGEIALSVVLLCGSGLLIRTLIHLQTLPPGFNADGVMTAKASLDDARYQDASAFGLLLEQSIAAMHRIPGVEDAAVGLSLPYERTLNDQVQLHDGPAAGQSVGTDLVYVSPGYFETLQIPLLAGRTFAPSDGSKTQQVAIVNQTFAHKFFPGINPVGHSIDKGVVIVGVVADVELSSGLNPTAPVMTEQTEYIPASQVDPRLIALVHVWFQPSWIVRTAVPVDGLPVQMQHALATAAPDLPFAGYYRMNDLLDKTLATQRVEVALLGTMAGLALLLSAVGIFAMVANMVAQRSREIGIRLALGSTRGQAISHVAAAGLRASATGLVLGLLLSLEALRAMRSVLYGVKVYDLPSILAVVAVLASVSLLATTLPALRIAKIDPARTLREE